MGDDSRLRKIKEVIDHGANATGQQNFINSLYGDRLQCSDMIRAYCYDCMEYYEDGIGDCFNLHCPLHSKMPYNLVLSAVPAPSREKNRNISRNPAYPLESRLRTATAEASSNKDLEKPLNASIISKKMKMKTRKYPQEITQKKCTLIEVGPKTAEQLRKEREASTKFKLRAEK